MSIISNLLKKFEAASLDEAGVASLFKSVRDQSSASTPDLDPLKDQFKVIKLIKFSDGDEWDDYNTLYNMTRRHQLKSASNTISDIKFKLGSVTRQYFYNSKTNTFIGVWKLNDEENTYLYMSNSIME